MKNKLNFSYKKENSDTTLLKSITKLQLEKSEQLSIDVLCDLAKSNDIEGMKDYINKFAHAKENFKSDVDITYPYNVAFNAYHYDFASEYQTVVTEILGTNIWHNSE